MLVGYGSKSGRMQNAVTGSRAIRAHWISISKSRHRRNPSGKVDHERNRAQLATRIPDLYENNTARTAFIQSSSQSAKACALASRNVRALIYILHLPPPTPLEEYSSYTRVLRRTAESHGRN